MNKPCLSVNDIINSVQPISKNLNQGTLWMTVDDKSLIELAKQKINNK